MTIITPTPGVVYRFVFVSGFDVFNGTYRLVKLMTYDEYLEDGGNLLTDFFTPNNKDETELAKDLEKIRVSKIMKLVSPDEMDNTVEVYAPLIYLENTPDHRVKEYKKFGIVSYIGITENAEDLDFVRDNITQQFQAALGITPDPKFVYTGSSWLTDEEYLEELAKRDETIKEIINYFSENKRLQTQMSATNSKLKAYEELILNLQQQVKDLQNQDTGGQ